jgi:hypothetical protein
MGASRLGGASGVHVLALDAAGRLGERERLVRMGWGRKWGGQCSTRSLSAAEAFPASVKGDAAHPGGAQVGRGLAGRASGSFRGGWVAVQKGCGAGSVMAWAGYPRA